ncbi:hypothetical protein V1512DRAFT_256055 [Lipomyces arxii]|uniref:uncharacterized protein n=1 Tax=Lipomyces arxii TaxID=56418 RepID=UPI0034CFC8AE
MRDMIRVALIKIRGVAGVQDQVLADIGRTISRLARLGLDPVVVVDPADVAETGYVTHERMADLTRLANRIQTGIERDGRKSVVVPPMFSRTTADTGLKWTVPHLLLLPMTSKIIPVVVPVAYDEHASRNTLCAADDVVIELASRIAGLARPDVIALDKVIFLDPVGGIPSTERGAAHVLVNIEQEYDAIMNELTDKRHVANLTALKRVLELSPASTSGLVTTLQVAASQSTRNPLIYNLLTDRPVISSSLPVDGKRAPAQATTLLRRGMPVMLVYSPGGMSLPTVTGPTPDIVNGLVVCDRVAEVDMAKLVELIENSFGRTLDVGRYLARVNGNIAGLVIAGDYEGGAIITWENKPGSDRVAYLDKFAVQRRSQGSAGVADIVFKAMVGLFSKELVWRSRTENVVNKWYFDRSNGMVKLPPGENGTKWTVFYTGTETRERPDVAAYVAVCSGVEPSFK